MPRALVLKTCAHSLSVGDPSVMRSSTGPDMPLTSTTQSRAEKEEEMNSESVWTESGDAISQC